MTTITVQFSDASESTITAYFSDPQSRGQYENLGTVDTSDARWHAFYNGMPKVIQQGVPGPD